MEGRKLEGFLANPGRLKELLIPGRPLLLKNAVPNGSRRTSLDVISVRLRDQIVTINSRIPNVLIREAFLARSLQEFNGYRLVKSEPAFGSRRFDFLLAPKCFMEVKSCTLVKKCFMEVKSCTLVKDGDAPTARGRYHLSEMVKALKQGYHCVVVFVVQREDARILRPNSHTIPSLAKLSKMPIAPESKPWPTLPRMRTIG
jgi:sugar fermentation stimulation protein A